MLLKMIPAELFELEFHKGFLEKLFISKDLSK